MKNHRMAASAILAIIVLAGPVPASAACDPPTRAVQYLVSQQAASGSIDSNVNETADFVLGAASGGIDPATLTSTAHKSPLDYFQADLAGTRKALQDANVLGKLIQAVVAGHRDPRAFGGIDLINTLRNGSTPGSSPKPYYDDSTGTFLDAISAGQNQAFTQANAILGLAAAADPGFKVPTAAISRLRNLQAPSGTSKGAWSSFGTFDTNDTSIALMALVASGDTPVSDPAVFNDAFSYLRSQQDLAGGGFTFSTDFGSTSDPDSDSFVIQALVSAGQDPAGTAWTNGGGNAPADILTFQDPQSGGFRFASGGKIQAFATSQAVLGLRRAPLPITGAYKPGATLPSAGCASPPGSAASGSEVKGAATVAPALPATGRRGDPADPRATLLLQAVIVWVVLGLTTAVAALARERRRPRR
jgi:hypothetical protein